MRRNSSEKLMQYFNVTDKQEFRDFWFSLTEDEQIYYRTIDLS